MGAVSRVFAELQPLDGGRRPRGHAKSMDVLREAVPKAHPAALAMAEEHRGESERVFPLLAATAEPGSLAQKWLCMAFTTGGMLEDWESIQPQLDAWRTFVADRGFTPASTEHLGWSEANDEAWGDVRRALWESEAESGPAEDAVCVGCLAGGEMVWVRPDGSLWLVNGEPDEQPFLKLLDDLGASFETLAAGLESGALRREEPGVWHYEGQTYDEGDDGWRTPS